MDGHDLRRESERWTRSWQTTPTTTFKANSRAGNGDSGRWGDGWTEQSKSMVVTLVVVAHLKTFTWPPNSEKTPKLCPFKTFLVVCSTLAKWNNNKTRKEKEESQEEERCDGIPTTTITTDRIPLIVRRTRSCFQSDPNPADQSKRRRLWIHFEDSDKVDITHYNKTERRGTSDLDIQVG